MKNHYQLIFTFVFLLFIGLIKLQAQVVYSDDFSNWTNGLPDGWGQNGTNIHPDSIVEYTSAPYSGTKSMRVNYSSANSNFFEVYSDSIFLESGVYSLGYYYKSSRVSRVSIQSTSSNPYVVIPEIPDTSLWQYAEVSFIINNSQNISIRFNVLIPPSVAGQHRMLIDDISIRKISEKIDMNNIKALINADGILFNSGYTSLPAFEVPKNSQKHTIYAAQPWVGGVNVVDSTIHLSGFTYSPINESQLYGPINDTVNDDFRNKYFRVWKITKSEIDYHIANYNQANYQMPEVIKNWPGNGNTQNGEPHGLAPYESVHGSIYYEPHNGDYPKIRGDQAIFFIYNDLSSVDDTLRPTMGIETHGMAYVFDAPNDSDLYNTLFLNYEVINRSNNNYEDVYFGFFADMDIGFFDDDYLGCDTVLNMYYGYNGIDTDGFEQPDHYGNPPPAQGIQYLNKPMTSFISYGKGNNPVTGAPNLNIHFHNYLRGKMRDGTPLVPPNFMFPGIPEQGIGITEESVGNNPFDRRGVMSHGPFNLDAGEKVCFDIAFPFAWDRNGTRLTSLALLRQRAAAIKTFYDAQNFDCDLTATSSEVNEMQRAAAKIYPNPNNGLFYLETNVFGNQTEIEIYSLLGKLVYKNNVRDAKSTIQLEESKGIYIYLIKNQKEIIQSGKLIVE